MFWLKEKTKCVKYTNSNIYLNYVCRENTESVYPEEELNILSEADPPVDSFVLGVTCRTKAAPWSPFQ